MSNEEPSQNSRPPVWGMVVVALVLLVGVVGYFIR